jgi:hypothetical protein
LTDFPYYTPVWTQEAPDEAPGIAGPAHEEKQEKSSMQLKIS